MRTVLAGTLAGVALLATGCDNAPDTFAITFFNDTGRNVVLKLCDDACHSFHYSDKLRLGGSVPENISTDNVFTRWAVNDAYGHGLGCLPFSFHGAYAKAVVRLTQMVPCPGKRPLPLARGTPDRS